MSMTKEMVALNADVVGYSALIADDLPAMTSIMTTYHELVDSQVTSNGGSVANFVGDAFMAVFENPMSALRAAIAITTHVEAANADRPVARQARFRMGMDLGPISVSDSGYHGDALNIAARIQALAPEGGLAVSGRVYRAIDEPALRFRPVGWRELKNIPEQVDVYEFADLPTDGTLALHNHGLSLESPSVAVLPIHTEMVDDSVRAAAGILRGDLLYRLSRVPGLTVIDVDAPADDGGPGAAARYMLETGVHQFGATVRVFATLLDVGTINVVKSHKWTVTADEMISISEEAADEVAKGIEIDLIVGEPAGLYAELNDPAAIEQVYLGWYHFRSDTQEGWAKAMDLFGSVMRSHPDKPYGYVLSAYAAWVAASNGWTSDAEATYREAHSLAARGSALGDPTGMATAIEAAVLMSQGKSAEALEALDGLDRVRPTCDVTYGLEGSVRRYLGEWEKAVELCDKAMRLTGLNKPWYPTVKASSLFVGGRNHEAALIAQGVLEYQPNNLEALLVLAAAQIEMGLERRAQGTAMLIRQRFPAVDVEAWLDKHPYQRRELVDRWKGDLMTAGAIPQ